MIKELFAYGFFIGMFFLCFCLPLTIVWMSKHDIFNLNLSDKSRWYLSDKRYYTRKEDVRFTSMENIWLINNEEVYGLETWWQGQHIIYNPVTDKILAIFN